MGDDFESVVVDDEYKLVRVRTPFVCLLHWVIVASVITLCVTGLYVGSPILMFGTGEPYDAFVMAKTRFVHFVTASVLLTALLLRLYHSFSPSTRRDIYEILPTPSNISGALHLMWFYLTGKGRHEHYRYLNPLGGISVFLMICLFALETTTGFALYSQQANHISWGWALWFPSLMGRIFGGMPGVRLLHHLGMYCLLSLVVVHVYMKVYVSIVFKEADIVSIISGHKLFRRDVIAQY
ncbi:MAG: Ni/Fe-hydrogenase, b-type cytochrome subunit [Nitrospinae bacterium]|nr:Ni/Fe-hydrogenase, b-type cytochrome subunit [Nitrospinota bacterium]